MPSSNWEDTRGWPSYGLFADFLDVSIYAMGSAIWYVFSCEQVKPFGQCLRQVVTPKEGLAHFLKSAFPRRCEKYGKDRTSIIQLGAPQDEGSPKMGLPPQKVTPHSTFEATLGGVNLFVRMVCWFAHPLHKWQIPLGGVSHIQTFLNVVEWPLESSTFVEPRPITWDTNQHCIIRQSSFVVCNPGFAHVVGLASSTWKQCRKDTVAIICVPLLRQTSVQETLGVGVTTEIDVVLQVRPLQTKFLLFSCLRVSFLGLMLNENSSLKKAVVWLPSPRLRVG